jgi:hypothetical protein
MRLTIWCDVIQFVKHVHSRYSDLLECQLAIVNAIEAQLPSHVLDLHTLAWLHVVVSDADDEGVDSLVLSLDYGLCEDNRIV